MIEVTKYIGATILIADDDKINLDVLETMLTQFGYDVRVALDGETVLRIVSADPPDLILLDINMPNLDGFQTCERLKQDPRTRDIPVIFVTAMTDERDRLKGFEHKAVDYVTKPVQIAELRARVDLHLELAYSRKKLKLYAHQLEKKVDEVSREQQRAEDHLRRLQESEARTRTIIENLVAGISDAVRACVFGFDSASQGSLDDEAVRGKVILGEHLVQALEQYAGLQILDVSDVIATAQPGYQVDSMDVEELPDTLRDALITCARSGDINGLTRNIDAARRINPTVGEHLNNLLSHYELDAIQNLLNRDQNS